MVPWLICCFIVIFLYIERKWPLKKNLATILPLTSKLSGKFQSLNAIDGSIEVLNIFEFPEISIKIKSFKTFYKVKQRTTLRKLFSHPPDKSLLRLWKKTFLTEIDRNTHTFFPQVLREYSSWASRNGAMQMFFSVFF